MGRSPVGGLDEEGRFLEESRGSAGDFWRRFGLLLAAEKKRGTNGQWQHEGELPGRKEEEMDERRQTSMRSFLQKADGRRSATQGRASGGWRRGGKRERGQETSTLGGEERGRDAVGDAGQGDDGWQREGREREGREGWRGRGGDIDAGGREGGRDAVGDAGEGDGGWRRGGKREGGRGRAVEGRYLGGRSRNAVDIGVVGAGVLQKADGGRPAASLDEREGERREGGGRRGGHEEERGRA